MSWFSFEICRILICEICNDIDLGWFKPHTNHVRRYNNLTVTTTRTNSERLNLITCSYHKLESYLDPAL